MAEVHSENQDALLARVVVEQGLATDKEVADCQALLAQLSGHGGHRQGLGELLVTNGLITRAQLTRLASRLDEERDEQQIPGYQILGKLGQGAMATVYLGRQVSLDRKVAVKVLPKRYLNSPEFVERFYAEGRAAAKLNHPNIVGALDVGRSGDHHYFVMEYVEGHTVYDDLSEIGRYSEAAGLKVIIDVARALEHAHKMGFVHRDVKPKNLMITKEGVCKLADMGLARAVSDREAAEAERGKAFGTPYYISPEQIRGLMDVDYRADIYGLGATFYHMMTGQVPFDGPNPSAVMHKHLKSELVAPDQINPSLSAGVCEIIEVMMAKDRNQRYNSCTDLLADLEAVRRGEPPMQARKKFDLSSLAHIEESSAATSTGLATAPAPTAPPALTQQPLFWAAIAGWLMAAIVTVILISLLIANAK